MRKKTFFSLLALSFLALSLISTDVFALGPSGRAGKSNIALLYLNEKDPNTWQIILKKEGGAWGKMKYNLSGPQFKFVFNGHKLEPDKSYTLIYYPDPWPGNGLICIGSDIASNDPVDNDVGNVHIAGSVELNTDLPTADDWNNPDNPNHESCHTSGTCIDGAKIWLVLTNDVDCIGDQTQVPPVPPHMTGWNPTEYLFEIKGIEYNDTDIP